MKHHAKIEAGPNPEVPLVARIILAQAGWRQADISYSSPGHRFSQSLQIDHEKTEIPLVGMRPGRVYEVAVTLTGTDGSSCQLDQLTWRTPPLPARLRDFPQLDVKTLKPAEMEPGVTLLSLRRRSVGRMLFNTAPQRQFLRDYSLIIALDVEAEIIWYFRASFRISGIHQLSNGNLFFHSADYRSFEMDFLGQIKQVWYASRRPAGPVEGGIAIDADSLHHQPHETPDGHFLALTANARSFEDYPSSETDPDAPAGPAKVVGDNVIEFNQQGDILWSWNAFDHLDPYRIGYDTFSAFWHVRGFPNHIDWSHGNGVTIDPADGCALVSLRNQDAFLKIDRQSNEIRWILGPHDGWKPPWSDKLLTPADPNMRWPWHGHNPRVNEDRTISIYDNGLYQARPFAQPLRPHQCPARGVEYRVDEEKRTVEQVWSSQSSDPDDEVISWAMGDCHKLPKTGNRFVIDSFCLPQGDYLTHLKNVNREDLGWNEWNRSEWHMSDFCYWGRIREYGQNNDVKLEIHLRDPDDIVGWEVYGGSRVRALTKQWQ